MGDIETSQDKSKEKKKKKVGSTKEKESRKKSVVESDQQTGPKLQVDSETIRDYSKDSDPTSEDPTYETSALSSTDALASEKCKMLGDSITESRKASLVDTTDRKLSGAEEISSPSISRKASAAAAPIPECESESEEMPCTIPTKAKELPPTVTSSYVPPVAASKKDVDLLQDLDENKLLELKEAFELFDYNQDGFIDYKDLKFTYHTLGYTEIDDQFIEGMLSEATSPLDFDAFVILLGYKTIELDPEAVLVDALSCWDYDNSGLIAEERIKHDLQKWGDKFTPEEAEQALEDAPVYVDKKGTIMIDYIKFSSNLCGLRKKTKST